jgi:sarcosine oxidase subunit beta
VSAVALEAVVIGGGIHGLSAALHLARGGCKVLVLERAWAGRHASGATAAGVRTLRRDFAEVPLALEAMDMWHRMSQIVGDDCGFRPHGQICVAETPRHFAAIEERAALARQHGYSHEEIIDRAELRRLVPALSPHCVGAIMVRRDGHADPHRTLAAFRRSAVEAGVDIREGVGVTAIERRGSDWVVIADSYRVVTPVIVNAAGAWAARIAAMVGDCIALGSKASMMIVTEPVAPLVSPVVSVLGRSLSFKQTDRGTVLIGGGLQGRGDLDHQQAFVDMAVLAKGAKAAVDLFPAVRDLRIARTWAGLEAKTTDLLPVIGPSPNAPGVVHVFGFSGHGFQLVPVVGAAVAELVIHGATGRPIGAFRAARLMPLKAAA